MREAASSKSMQWYAETSNEFFASLQFVSDEVVSSCYKEAPPMCRFTSYCGSFRGKETDTAHGHRTE